jgi:DNA repair exonuclease SbcCD ATPase subunit
MLWALAIGSGIAQEDRTGTEVQDRPGGEIVFIIDESGSMFNDLEEVKRHLVEIVGQLAARVDLRLGLVGFGAFEGHRGTRYPGQPHIHLPLSRDIEAFTDALDGLVSGGSLEPGFSAIVLAMSDEMGFRADAATCAILITDEDADVYEQAPETKAAALEALGRRNAVFLGVVGFEGFIDPGFEAAPGDYGPGPDSLADLTGGEVFNIVEFRSDPGPVLSAIMTSCVRRITGEREPPREREQPEAPMAERFRLILATIAELREQVEDNRGKLMSLEDEVTSLSTTLASLRRVTQIVRENRQQLIHMQDKITTFDVRIASLSTTVADLTAEHEGLAARLDLITDRVDSLDAELKALASAELAARMEALEKDLDSLRKKQREHRQRHDQMYSQMGERMKGLGEKLGSLSAFVSQLMAAVEPLSALPQEVLKLQASLAELDTVVSEQIKGLVVRIETNELAIGKLQEDLKGSIVVTEKFLENFGMLARRLDAVKGGLEHLQAGLEGLDLQLKSDTESLSTRVDRLETLAASHQDKLAQFDALLERLSQLEGGLAKLTARQAAQLNEAFQRLEELRLQLTQMGQDLALLAQKVEDNSRAMSENASKLAEVQSQLSRLQEGLNAQDERLMAEIEVNRKAIEELKSLLAGVREEIKQEVSAAIEREDPTTRRLAELALAFSLAAVGVAWLLFMQAAG